MTYDSYRLKRSSCGALFLEKLNNCDFSIFAITRTATVLMPSNAASQQIFLVIRTNIFGQLYLLLKESLLIKVTGKT